MRAVLSASDTLLMNRMLYQFHPRFGLLWNVGVATGLRIGDLLKLKVEVANTDIYTVKEQKTGKEKLIDLPQDIRQEIGLYAFKHRLSTSDYLFFSSTRNRRKPMTRQWAHSIIARTARLRGLKDVGAHSMRKIYACNVFASSGSINAVQAALGHEHPSTTLVYLRDILEHNHKAGG